MKNDVFFKNDDERNEYRRLVSTANHPITHDLRFFLKVNEISDCNDLINWLTLRIRDCSTDYQGFSKELTFNQRSAIKDWLTLAPYRSREEYFSIRQKLDHDDNPENYRFKN